MANETSLGRQLILENAQRQAVAMERSVLEREFVSLVDLLATAQQGIDQKDAELKEAAATLNELLEQLKVSSDLVQRYKVLALALSQQLEESQAMKQ